VVTALTEVLRSAVPRLLQGASGEYEIIAFGLLLMVIMIFMPQGVVQGLTEIYGRWRTGEQGPLARQTMLPQPLLRWWPRIKG
jgi:branched-chain amino acid transport system permease protein